MENKNIIKENNLLDLLKPFFTYWISQFIGNAIENIGSYIDGSSDIRKAIKTILGNLYDNSRVIAKLNAIIADYGYDSTAVDRLMSLPEFKKEIDKYKNVDGIDYSELEAQIRKTLIQAFKDESNANAATNKIKSKLK